MTRWLRAGAGLVTLIVLVVGVPLILIRVAGWPLPSTVPAFGDMATKVRQGNIESEVVINSIAVVVWIAWVQLMWAVVWETIVNVPRLVAGRRWRPAPLVVGPVGDGVARLFSVILAVGVLSSTATPSVSALSMSSSPPLSDAATSLVLERTLDDNGATSTARSVAVAEPNVRWHTSADDDLWDIAATALGDGSRVDEIVALNPGLTARSLRAGMSIELPPGAVIPADRSTASVEADDIEESDAKRYVVQNNDGMWNVAEALLGDGSRHVELSRLLDGQEVAPGVFFDADAAVIHPGWEFSLGVERPVPQPSANGHRVVEPGESLWEIAADELGEPTRWAEIWELQDGEVMNDGRVFDDPNTIQPGWELKIPTAAAGTPPPAPYIEDSATSPTSLSEDDTEPQSPALEDSATSPTSLSEDDTEPQSPALEEPSASAGPSPTEDDTSVSVSDAQRSSTELPPPSEPVGTSAPAPVEVPPTIGSELSEEGTPAVSAELVAVRDHRPVWMLGITGTTVLASGLWAVAAWYRRRAGARGGAHLRESNTSSQLVDAALRSSADQPLLSWANVALGELVARCGINTHGALPLIVKLSPEDGLRVQWEPPLPTESFGGWRIEAGGRQWHLPAPDIEELAVAGPVAIPGLATIGRFDGNEVLVDLESCGSLSVSGDVTLSESLVRSIVLELGAGGLLSNAQVHTVGLDVDGAEQLHRVRSRGEREVIEHVRTIRVQHDAVLDEANRGSMLEVRAASSPVGREVTIIAVRADACARLEELLECAAPQRGIAVVVLGDAACATSLKIGADRTGVLAPLGVVVDVAGVPRQTAAALAVHLDRVSAAVDVDALGAPRVVETIRTRAWTEPATLVRLLGPPRVDDAEALGWRELEMAAFLAAHDGAATDDELIDAVFCGRAERGVVWDLVGRLRAGAPHLLAAQNEGSNTISLADGVMSDVAWMDCLVGRSHQLGDEDAISGLVAALDLVEGAPFDGPAGCAWAVTGGELAGALELIERTAFLLTERSITVGEFGRARASISKTMRRVGPNEQLTRTLMRLEDAAGNAAAVQDAYGDLSFDLGDLSGPSDFVIPTSGTTTMLETRESPAEVAAGVEFAETDHPVVRETVRPRVLLRVFGEVCVEGTASTQALSVAFAVAAAGRSMSGDELAELTGYSRKSLSTVFTSGHDIVDREDGRLRLSSGVWTDHGWMLECARRARSADEAGDVHEVSEWLRSLFAELNRVDAAAFASPPGKDAYWRWVDDFPADVPARMASESQLVEAALIGGEVWSAAAAEEYLPAEVVVRTLTKLARVIPYASVPSGVRPSDFRSSAENLLLAAHHVAKGRGELTNSVQAAARRLVADDAIEASDTLADALGL